MLDRIARPTLIGLNLFLGIAAVLGAVAELPTLPLAWLAGTPFPDDTIPALALGTVGGGAFVAAALLLLRLDSGVSASLLVGLAIALFAVVETAVIGLDIWLHALGLRPTRDPVSAALLGAEGVPTLLGIPAPLWRQPFYVVQRHYVALGVAILALAWRPRARQATGGHATHPVGR